MAARPASLDSQDGMGWEGLGAGLPRACMARAPLGRGKSSRTHPPWALGTGGCAGACWPESPACAGMGKFYRCVSRKYQGVTSAEGTQCWEMG